MSLISIFPWFLEVHNLFDRKFGFLVQKLDQIKTDLLVEFSPQSESGPSPGGGQGQGVAEVRVGKKARDHTAGLQVMSDTAALTLLLRRPLAGKEHDLVSSVFY